MSTGGPSDSANGEAQDTRKWYEGPERFKVNAHEMWKREALQHAGVFERAGDDHRAARRHAAAAEAYDTAMRYHHEFHGFFTYDMLRVCNKIKDEYAALGKSGDVFLAERLAARIQNALNWK